MKIQNPSVAAVTRFHSFGDVVRGTSMFAVQQGVPAVEALEYALYLLSAAAAQIKVAADAAGDVNEENRSLATYHLVESVQALLSASVSGMREVE